MQNLIKMISQLIQASTDTNSAMHQTAKKIEAFAGDLKDRDHAISEITDLAFELRDMDHGKERTPESDARAYAWNFCFAAIGLIKADNGLHQAYFAPYELDVIADLLAVKVQEVGSNQAIDQKRFYTEDRSEYQHNSLHHLIDINQRDGRYYGTLKIHQFNTQSENSRSVMLACNEVEELTAITIQMHLDRAKRLDEEAHAGVKKPVGDDFDPFLDSDDLP